jgi:hypothetical protein
VHSRIKSGYERTAYCWREFIPDFKPLTGSAFPDKIRLRKNHVLLEGIYSRFQTPTGSAFLDKIRATKEARIVGGNLFPISNPEPEVHSRIKSGYGRTEYCWREFIPDSEPRTGSAFPDKIRLRKNPCCWRECIPDSEPRAGSVFPDKIRLRKNRVLLEGIYSRTLTTALAGQS